MCIRDSCHTCSSESSSLCSNCLLFDSNLSLFSIQQNFANTTGQCKRERYGRGNRLGSMNKAGLLCKTLMALFNNLKRQLIYEALPCPPPKLRPCIEEFRYHKESSEQFGGLLLDKVSGGAVILKLWKLVYFAKSVWLFHGLQYWSPKVFLGLLHPV